MNSTDTYCKHLPGGCNSTDTYYKHSIFQAGALMNSQPPATGSLFVLTLHTQTENTKKIKAQVSMFYLYCSFFDQKAKYNLGFGAEWENHFV